MMAMPDFFANKVVAGLGNPGSKYENTFHNVGFMLLDNYFVHDTSSWRQEKNFNSLIAKSETTLFVKPLTYMNDSGKAISKVLNFYKKTPQDLIVIHDDVDLAFGKIKLVRNRGSAGHHGIDSVNELLGTTDYYRIRVGVGRPTLNTYDVLDYVLSTITNEKRQELFKSFELFLKTV